MSDPEKVISEWPPSSERRSHNLETGQVWRSKKAALAFLTVFALLDVGWCKLNQQPLTEGKGLHFFDEVAYQNGHHKKPMSNAESEKLFLSVPNAESALSGSRDYATHPHLAGSSQDFSDALVMLHLFQDEFSITPSKKEPIFDAGSHSSRASTLGLTSSLRSTKPSAWIDVYYPVMNTPLDRQLSIIDDTGNTVWEADLTEDGDPADEEAHKYKDYVPAWHGLSKHGDAEGELIYANYGTQEDYAELVAAGANLTGKIVITRYGAIFRGLKIFGAEQLGAAAVLIYSDPRDDGFVTVENGYAPYPAGPARNPTSVQRGSVVYLSMYPGDPTTPGYPSYKNGNRTQGDNIPKIPSLPISWHNAERLLEEIDGIYLNGGRLEHGKRWLSGKASKAKVKLANHVNDKVTPIWNTMAAIPGHIKDEVVLLGCHRDAWVMGAADPTSGTISMREVIKGFGTLMKHGWRPLRTVLFASWDAEEYGLIGSTEYGEDFSSWISEHVVTYLNLDVSVSGSRWNVGGSPSLAHLLKNTALAVSHPTDKDRTLWDARLDEGPFSGTEFAHLTGSVPKLDAEFMHWYNRMPEIAASKTNVRPLGSGSDFTVFLQRLGVASSDTGFGFTPTDAVYHYHSIYDSQRWQEVYGDPGFLRHVAVAKQHGLMALRLIDSVILPLNTSQYALELSDYLKRVEDLAELSSIEAPDFSDLRVAIDAVQSSSFKLDAEKAEAEKEFKSILSKFPGRYSKWTRCDGILRLVVQMIEKIIPMKWLSSPPEPPFISDSDGLSSHSYTGILGGLEIWEASLLRDSDDPERSFPHLPHGFPILKFIKAAKRVANVNRKLRSFERGFLHDEGIKDREWYRHLGVAPGRWLGYGATTFPALTEAITIEQNSTLVSYEASRLSGLLKKLAKEIHP